MKRILLIACCIYFAATGLKAQTLKYLAEYDKGYRGGFITGQVSREDALEFAVLGDFGRGGEYFQKDVANTLSEAVTGINAAFIISTGDNIYPDGVASVHDPLWNLSFENVFFQYPLHRAWYAVLGNHDYHGNAQAQIDYSKVSQRWHMPSRYYAFKRKISGNAEALFVFLDTNPLDPEAYRSAYGKELLAQDSAAQKRWLEQTLSDTSSNIRWKIVVAHHPCYTAGNRALNTPYIRYSLEPVLEKYKVDLYISGHEHHLQYYHPAGKHTHHFISGAGSEANENLKPRGNYDFFEPIQGFMTFSILPENVQVQAIDRRGVVLKTILVKK
ncbi:purple acid phosphatase family protein [Chitinophaga flava]|uniref:acid phosphatase n=1 Tax=Chitinophaga flava TaxID=2259036 RepID=A0A365XWE1_9BACT|nr:tartrate-resistant acid phosphatase type 5 family protein [Chitinophaga flava]RBL90682.1 acid phosphatase [Chitinophaga flava]